jgi:peptidyl-prolyl cis-trans isomerase SurA
MVNWAHIIVQVNQLKADGTTMTPEEVVKANDEAKAKLEGILADIKAKKITFEAAAKQFSQDGAGQRGGELGMLDPRSLDADFTKAGNTIAKAGDITGPIKSQFGWHLIKLIKRGKDASAIEKAQYKRNLLDQIANNQQELQGWVTSLLTKAKIERNGDAVTSLGSAPAPTTKNVTPKPKAAVKPSHRSGR